MTLYDILIIIICPATIDRLDEIILNLVCHHHYNSATKHVGGTKRL
jgi:hypothetical protein